MEPGTGFRMGDVVVQPDLRRVTKNGHSRRLEPKVMKVLITLAAKPGTVVSRQELQDAVWATPYVSEDLPRRAISALRRALGDRASTPRYIETIPRAGYRLLLPVEPLKVEVQYGEPKDGEPTDGDSIVVGAAPISTIDVPARGAAAIDPPATEDRGDPELADGDANPGAVAHPIGGQRGIETNRRRRQSSSVILLSVLALVAVAARFGAMQRDASTTATRHVVPLTTRPGLEYDPAISPDGSRVAYLRSAGTTGDSSVTLELQLLDSTQSLTLGEPVADLDHPIESLAWSPNGTQLAYRRWKSGEGWGLYTVSALGGAERKLVDLGRAETSGLSWSPAGGSLVLGRSPGDGAPLALQRFDRSSERLDTLSVPPPTAIGDTLPAFSPDGGTIAFARVHGADVVELRLMDADGTNDRSLLPGRHKIADLDWSADGRWIVTASFEGGRHQLWRIEAQSGRIDRITGAGDGARWLSTSRTGNHLVYARTRFELGLCTLDLTRGETTTLPMISSTFFDEALSLSPAGDRLASVSTRSGSFEIWTSGLNGQNPVRLTDFGHARIGRPAWVSGGRTLVFDANPDGRFDLFSVDASGGHPRQLTDNDGDDRLPSASADGETVYFASNRSGSWQVWRTTAVGGPADQVTTEGGYFAQPSLDGTWLYFTRFRQSGLWRVRLTTPGAPAQRLLPDAPSIWEWGNWIVTDTGIWVITRDLAGQVLLSLFNATTGDQIRQVPFDGTPVRPSLSRAPNDGHLLLARVERVESDLMLVESLTIR